MAYVLDNPTTEEKKFLYSNRPYSDDVYEIVERYFGVEPADWIWDFVEDLKNLGENWARVLKARGELTSVNCARCALMKSHFMNISQCVNKFQESVKSMDDAVREYDGSVLVFDDNSSSANCQEKMM